MQHIAILDFGSQYTHLIARRIRELGVRAQLYSAQTNARELHTEVLGIILSGGPQSVYDNKAVQVDPALFSFGAPILGLCYGHQLMAHHTGGTVAAGTIREYGRAQLDIKPNVLFEHLPHKSDVWMSHGDSVTSVGEGFEVIGTTPDCAIAAMANDKKQWYGLQFHPEVHHTAHGVDILKNFVFSLCKAEKNWNIADRIEQIVNNIQHKAQNKKVFVLVSGGVDSSVAFALLTRALGADRVYGLYIDTGYMRKDESAHIESDFKKAGFTNIHTFDAHHIFYERLRNVFDPEQKRKIIGQTFIDVKDMVAKKLSLDGDEWMLGQGTIYPDTIETGGTTHAQTIKTHHNRVDAIQKMIAHGKVIEPIADFYKDEVRELGRLLGVPRHMIARHPFPGPGLAIRILCYNPDDISEEMPAATYHEGARLPIRSVGVQGDNRTYAHPLAIWKKGNWEALDAYARAITNTYTEINRVVLALNSTNTRSCSFPSDKRDLNKERIALLQDIDALVMHEITHAGYYDRLWQCPVVLAPVGFQHFESVILRPVVSQEAMTAHFAQLDRAFLKELAQKIVEKHPIDYVFYDITNKPPGTIEWE